MASDLRAFRGSTFTTTTAPSLYVCTAVQCSVKALTSFAQSFSDNIMSSTSTFMGGLQNFRDSFFRKHLPFGLSHTLFSCPALITAASHCTRYAFNFWDLSHCSHCLELFFGPFFISGTGSYNTGGALIAFSPNLTSFFVLIEIIEIHEVS